MTEENREESECLPTAAEVILTDDSPELRRVEIKDYTGGLLEVGDELVRRKDHLEDKEKALEEQREEFEALIQEKIEKWENSGYCKDQYGDRPLKELLDEVQDQ